MTQQEARARDVAQRQHHLKQAERLTAELTQCQRALAAEEAREPERQAAANQLALARDQLPRYQQLDERTAELGRARKAAQQATKDAQQQSKKVERGKKRQAELDAKLEQIGSPQVKVAEENRTLDKLTQQDAAYQQTRQKLRAYRELIAKVGRLQSAYLQAQRAYSGADQAFAQAQERYYASQGSWRLSSPRVSHVRSAAPQSIHCRRGRPTRRRTKSSSTSSRLLVMPPSKKCAAHLQPQLPREAGWQRAESSSPKSWLLCPGHKPVA